jgi:quercetin dioxygenase-like cupin family protein
MRSRWDLVATVALGMVVGVWAGALYSQDRGTVAPGMKILIEKERVRVQYHDVAMGETVPLHSHPPYVVYVLKPYKAKLRRSDGSETLVQRKPGDVFWSEAVTHSVQNIGDNEIHNLIVEVKTPASTRGPEKGAALTTRASGTFDVKLTPQATAEKAGEALGRMSIDKQFHGDLEGTSQGEMLTAGTAVKGSAGYVAIERVSGTLHGRRGTFMLQHSGTLARGAAQLTITVVPDSGSDELTGLAGRLTIDIADGKHSHEFEYTLAPAP